jgi:hypothetical protein
MLSLDIAKCADALDEHRVPAPRRRAPMPRTWPISAARRAGTSATPPNDDDLRRRRRPTSTMTYVTKTRWVAAQPSPGANACMPLWLAGSARFGALTRQVIGSGQKKPPRASPFQIIHAR